MNKTAILKCSPFTTGLTRALKGSTMRLHCNVDADNNAYLTNGYFAVKLTTQEYEILARPVTQRDAGNWVQNEDGTLNDSKPIDLVKLLDDAAKEAVHTVHAAPMLFDAPKGKSKAQLVGYYSDTGDFVTVFDSVYASIAGPDLDRKSGGSIKPMVVYNAGGPIAMILPIKINSPHIGRSVRAWFTDGNSDSKAAKTAEKLRRQVEELELAAEKNECEKAQLRQQSEELLHRYTQEHMEVMDLREQLDKLQAALATKSEQIEALTARLNAQAAPEEAVQPTEQTPAEKAAALVCRFTALEGVTATVKGAQTTAPVVWLAGDTAAHKDKIESMGGRWSGKRAAWYIKVN